MLERSVANAERSSNDAEHREMLAEHRRSLRRHKRMLAAALRSDPKLVDAYLVYADWLLERDDPYGALIVVQHRILTTVARDRALEDAEETILRTLEATVRPWPTWPRSA